MWIIFHWSVSFDIKFPDFMYHFMRKMSFKNHKLMFSIDIQVHELPKVYLCSACIGARPPKIQGIPKLFSTMIER